MKHLIIVLSLILGLVQPALAQNADDGGEDLVASTRNDLLIVAGAGLGGAILGLSTLSFYDEPSQHIRNIYTGAALGIVAGVIVVAVNYADKSQEAIRGAVSYRSEQRFSTFERSSWHQEQFARLAFQGAQSLWQAQF